jgi:chromate transport protein ChrA
MAISAIATATLISYVIHAPWGVPNVYNDITGSFWGRCWVQNGALPYIPTSTANCDYAFEYPTISGLILYAARLFGSDLPTFYNTVSAMTMVAAVVVAGGTWAIARRLGKKLDPLYFMMPTFLVYGIYNFDMFHAAFVVLSILSFVTGKRTLSAAFLGLGFDTKLTSVVLLPIFLMEIRSDWPPKGAGEIAAKGPPATWQEKLRALPHRSKVFLLWFRHWSSSQQTKSQTSSSPGRGA